MTEERKGNIYILTEMILWALFPIFGALGLAGVLPIVSLFWVSAFAAGFFLCLMFYKGKWHELKNKKVWGYTLGVVIFICVLFYGFYFYGLAKTSPANASIAALFEVVPTYIFFQIIKKEHFSLKHILGVIIGVVGAIIVLLPKAGVVSVGDFIILAGTFFPPIGNYFQQKVRKLASTETILFLRHIMALPFLIGFIFIFNTQNTFWSIGEVWPWLLINGVFIFGVSKIFWVEAIHRMTVTRAIAISGLNPIFTVLFAWVILSQIPTASQLLSLPFMICAVWLLTDMSFRKNSAKV